MTEAREFNVQLTIQDLSNTLKDVANNTIYFGGFNAKKTQRAQAIIDFRKKVKEWIEEDRVATLELENTVLKAENEELAAKVERLKISLNRRYGPVVRYRNLEC